MSNFFAHRSSPHLSLFSGTKIVWFFLSVKASSPRKSCSWHRGTTFGCFLVRSLVGLRAWFVLENCLKEVKSSPNPRKSCSWHRGTTFGRILEHSLVGLRAGFALEKCLKDFKSLGLGNRLGVVGEPQLATYFARLKK